MFRPLSQFSSFQSARVTGMTAGRGYIALAGLWGSPISGASMNPARTFGPDLAVPSPADPKLAFSQVRKSEADVHPDGTTERVEVAVRALRTPW